MAGLELVQPQGQRKTVFAARAVEMPPSLAVPYVSAGEHQRIAEQTELGRDVAGERDEIDRL